MGAWSVPLHAADGVLREAFSDAFSGAFSGSAALESRVFINKASHPAQFNGALNVSLNVKPEFYYEWDGGDQSVTASVFARWDQHDTKRSHVDIRQLTWLKAKDNWEIRAGIRKVFWGVTEISHTVDVINQTDQAEDLNFEAKLGQPMLNVAWIQPWGTLDAFILPYFRERTFAGKHGRLRPALLIDTANARYQSPRKQKHVDVALRWSHYLGNWDMALSQFYGTSREPLLQPTPSANGFLLRPYYALMHQTGLELQGTFDAWLIKLEAMHRSTPSDTFNTVTPALEYTFFDVQASGLDVGVLVEYMKDARRTPTLLNNDVFIGTRIAWNDIQSSALLFGVTRDFDNGSYFLFLEGSRRLGDRWKVSAEARTFHRVPPNDPAFDVRNDDLIQIELTGYY